MIPVKIITKEEAEKRWWTNKDTSSWRWITPFALSCHKKASWDIEIKQIDVKTWYEKLIYKT